VRKLTLFHESKLLIYSARDKKDAQGMSRSSSQFNYIIDTCLISRRIHFHSLLLFLFTNSFVTLDTTLCDALVARGEYIEVLRWEDLMDRCLKKMTACHQVTFAGSRPQIRRGHFEPIELDVVQRGANKKVTRLNSKMINKGCSCGSARVASDSRFKF
jgi:hypothetical protein